VELAKTLGATYGLDITSPEFVNKNKKIVGGQRTIITIGTTGHPELMA